MLALIMALAVAAAVATLVLVKSGAAGEGDDGVKAAAATEGDDGATAAAAGKPDNGATAAAATAKGDDGEPLVITLEARPGTWELAPGRRVQALTYNGTVPGPTIEGRVGDQVIVKFTNSLEEATTIHWHGLRVTAPMDGSPVAQSAVPPGGSFEYRFRLADAGTFWYHPHVSGADQMERGLYGAIVVRGPDEPKVDAEQVLMLDDLRLDERGEIAPEDPSDIYAGRHGNVLLVNGRADFEVDLRSGETQRWRLIDVANARIFRLGLEGHTMKVIGSDGGFAERAVAVDQLVMVPGDRYDVLVRANAAPGSSANLVTQSVRRRGRGHGRGHGHAGRNRDPDRDAASLLRLSYSDEPARASLEPVLPKVTLPDLDVKGVAVQTIQFGRSHGMRRSGEFTVNGEVYPKGDPIVAAVGETVVWDIVNRTSGDHPFHLHGFFFRVIERTGDPSPVEAWEDSINVAPRERVRIAFRLDDRPGRWLYHCHIIEHAEHGMTAELVVSSPNELQQ